MTQIITYVQQNIDTIGAIIIGILSVLSGIFELLGKTAASKWCGTFSADVGRFIRWLKSRSIALKGGLVASVVLLAFVQGCSLESARQVRVNSQLQAQAKGIPLQVRPETECKRLDDVHVYTMYGAEVSLGVGIGAGSLAAATSNATRDVATGVGIGAAAVAGTLAYWSQKSGSIWAEQCSQ